MKQTSNPANTGPKGLDGIPPAEAPAGAAPDTLGTVHYIGKAAGHNEIVGDTFPGSRPNGVEAFQGHPDIQSEITIQREHFKITATDATKGEGSLLSKDARPLIEKIDTVPVYVTSPSASTRQTTVVPIHATTEVAFEGPSSGKLDEAGLKEVEARIRDEATYKFALTIGNYGSSWLNGAIAAHIGASLDYGQSSRINPKDRWSPGTINVEPRKLLAALHTGGDKFVPSNLATRAFSSRDTKEAELYEDTLNDAWKDYLPEGADLLTCVNRRVSELVSGRHNSTPDEAISAAAAQVALEIQDKELRARVFEAPGPRAISS